MSGWQPSPRYPDPSVVVADESFNRYRLPLAKVERLATGITRWAEGPVWFGDQRCLLVERRARRLHVALGRGNRRSRCLAQAFARFHFTDRVFSPKACWTLRARQLMA